MIDTKRLLNHEQLNSILILNSLSGNYADGLKDYQQFPLGILTGNKKSTTAHRVHGARPVYKSLSLCTL